jgi:hypothetical protein
LEGNDESIWGIYLFCSFLLNSNTLKHMALFVKNYRNKADIDATNFSLVVSCLFLKAAAQNPNLQELELERVNMCGILPDLLRQATNLWRLELFMCKFLLPQKGSTTREYKIQEITDAIGKSTSLQHVKLYDISNEQVAIAILSGFESCESKLNDLFICVETAPDQSFILPSIQSLILRSSTLRVLNFFNFALNQTRMQLLSQAMTSPERHSIVSTLVISGCTFHDIESILLFQQLVLTCLISTLCQSDGVCLPTNFNWIGENDDAETDVEETGDEETDDERYDDPYKLLFSIL